jgi:hypothetical protein
MDKEKRKGRYPFGKMEQARKTQGIGGWGLKNIHFLGQELVEKSL